MRGDPSELKSENNSKGSGLDGLHVRNKVNLLKGLILVKFWMLLMIKEQSTYS